MDARRLLPALLAGVILAGCAGNTPTPAPTAMPTPSPSPTLAPTPSPAPTPEATPTPRPTASALPTVAPQDWQAYAAADKTWKAVFPGAPLSGSMPITSGTVKATAKYWAVMASMDAGYMVMTVDFPANTFRGATTEFLYDAMEKGMATSVPNGTVSGRRNLKVTGHAARALQLVGGQRTMDLVLALVQSRMYMVLVLYPTGAPLETDHFVESFQILK